MRLTSSGCAAALLLFFGGACEAKAGFVYDIQNYPSFQNGFTLSGTITTAIDSGTLAPADITAWTITITASGGGATTYSSAMPGYNLSGTAGDIHVSPTAITLGAGVLSFNNDINYSPLQYNRSNSGGNYLYVSRPDGFTINWFSSVGPTSLGGDPWVIATAGSSVAPEPTSLTMVMVGMAAVAGYRWRRRAGANRASA